MKKGEEIVEIANKLVNSLEVQQNIDFDNNLRNFLKVQNISGKPQSTYVGWKSGEKWCAFFAKAVWMKAYENDKERLNFIKKYISPSSAQNVNNFSNKNSKACKEAIRLGFKIRSSNPEPGSFFSFKRTTEGGHSGIIVADLGDSYEIIDGNVGVVKTPVRKEGVSRRKSLLKENVEKIIFIIPAESDSPPGSVEIDDTTDNKSKNNTNGGDNYNTSNSYKKESSTILANIDRISIKFEELRVENIKPEEIKKEIKEKETEKQSKSETNIDAIVILDANKNKKESPRNKKKK